MPEFGEEAGRVVRVEIRPDAPLLGARAHLALRRAEQLGKVTGVMPPAANFDAQGFDGRFTFRLDAPVGESQIVAAIEAAGEIASVAVDADTVRRPPCPRRRLRRPGAARFGWTAGGSTR
jgi:hypothetical protein